jgi:hypothetical protein
MPSQKKRPADTYSTEWHEREARLAARTWSFDGLSRRRIVITTGGLARLSFFGYIALDEARSRKAGQYRSTMGRCTSGPVPLPRAVEARVRSRQAQGLMESTAAKLLGRVQDICINLRKAA